METVELYLTFGNVYFILSITYSFVSLLDVHTLMITHYTHYS